MTDSYCETTISLQSDLTLYDNKTLKDLYVNFYNKVRLGKILEDLDSMAGKIDILFLLNFAVSAVISVIVSCIY